MYIFSPAPTFFFVAPVVEVRAWMHPRRWVGKASYQTYIAGSDKSSWRLS